jgi:uncharacterized membrane-anchored protein
MRPPVIGRFRRKTADATLSGVARLDRRTKDLIHRIQPGEIAVIAHEDLDQIAAEGLVERGVAAVVNCNRSTTGRYPNAGPLVLARAGIPLLDDAGAQILDRITDGERISIADDGTIFARDERIGTGVFLNGAALEAVLTLAESAMGEELERFVRNTMSYLASERDLVLRGFGIPEISTKIEGRPVVVVIRGHEYRKDLQTLRAYITEMRPVLIAVDGAADALLDEGLRPDLIIGDMDSVSTPALTCGAEVIVHAYPDGRAPGEERVRALGVECRTLSSAGTSEDIALLLAYEKKADLIVAVGAHDNLVEFLDKGRAGMASTFIVRLKVGPKLVDAKGVNRLYRPQLRTRDVGLLVASAFAALTVATFLASPSLRLLARLLVDQLKDLVR